MVQVAPIRDEDRDAVPVPPDDGVAGVQNRHRECEHRTARLSAVAAFASPRTAAAPSRNPSSIDPESPMNDRAGLKLWRRKPRAEPAATAASVMVRTSWREGAALRSGRPGITGTPAASPA